MRGELDDETGQGESHPVLTEEEDRDQRGEDPVGTGPTPSADGPTFRSSPERRAALRDFISRREPRSRQDELWPYLLIRAYAGDTGIRQPPVGYFWESPDVIVVEGDVPDLDGQTPTLTPRPGVDHTVFVRVWNLGRFEAATVKVRLWWANPAFTFDATSPNPPTYIGGTSIDLADRYHFPACRGLVRIPALWNPVVVNNGHECLLATADCFADPASPGFEASTDRHVGQLNLNLLLPDTDLQPLLEGLSSLLPLSADLHLLHGMAALTPLLAARGAEFVERTGLMAADRLPDLAFPLHDGQGHLGAAVQVDDEIRYLGGAEAAERLNRHDEPFDDHRRGAGAPHNLATELVRRSLDVDRITARAVADRLGPGVGHLLRLVAVRRGRTLGGYSLVVHT